MSRLGGDLGPTRKMFVQREPQTNLESLPSCPQKQQNKTEKPCTVQLRLNVLETEGGGALCPQVPVWLAGPVLRQVYPAPGLRPRHL